MLTDEEIMAQVLAAFQEEEAEHRQAITDILLEIEREPEHPKRKDMIDQLFREAHSLKGGARAAGLEEVEQLAHCMEDLFSAVRAAKIQLDPDVCDSIYASVDAIGEMMSQINAGKKTLDSHQSVLDDLYRILKERVKSAEPASEQSASSTQETPPAAEEPAATAPAADAVVPPPPSSSSPAEAVALPEEGHSTVASPPVTAVPEPATTTAESPSHTMAETTAQATSEEAEAPAPPSAPTTAPAQSEPPVRPEGSKPPAKQPAEPERPQELAPTAEGSSSGETHGETIATVRLATTTLDNLLNETGELITCSVRAQQRAIEARTLADLSVRWKRIWRHVRPVLTRLQSYTPAALQPTVHHLNDRETDMSFVERAAKILEQSEGGTQNTIASQLTTLIDAVNHANNIISELEQKLNYHARLSTEDHTRLSTVTDRLHDQIRRTRMLPITTLLSPLRLQMREIARAAGKQVELELDDGGAEADRQVLERLREVLLHLLRNGVDHGIEPPEVRVAHNKPPVGHIILRAAVSGDYLTILVEDDGAGLDVESIRERALNGGVLSEADLARVTESELIDLIFLPGFTTRQMVSKMSGRGVGLDVVRSQVERMHGRVTVQSFRGIGSIFTISVPLSLTSSHGLLLRIEQSTYMLPLDSVQRIVSVAPNDIKILEGRACLMIDDRPLGLVHLSDLLGKSERTGIKDERKDGKFKHHEALVGGRTASGTNWSLALLLGSGERQIACMVDAVLGEQELVVYRLPAPLQRVRFIAGATILADGSVVPILDVVDVVRAAIGTRFVVNQTTETVESSRLPTVLVVDDSITTRTLEKNILEAAGYQVDLATDGVEALDMLRRMMEENGCDLLLSDIDMPRLNGFELTSKVRADSLLKHIPIVLVTSLDTPADRERGISAGADAYIVKKSFDQQALLDTIEQLI